MSDYVVSESEYEAMMDAENAQFVELKAVSWSDLPAIDNETAPASMLHQAQPKPLLAAWANPSAAVSAPCLALPSYGDASASPGN